VNHSDIKGLETMPADDLLTLCAGPLRLELSPPIGGSIARFSWTAGGSELPIMREPEAVLERVLDAASFPLVPYVNRIRGGSFSFGGREVSLQPNMAGDPSPLHGQGWLSRWEVEDSDSAHATLTFDHAAGEWPWAYRARQLFELDERGLSVKLSCENRADEPMPCGLGQHPYFPCSPETVLDTEVAVAWTVDEQVLPVERVPAEGRYDLKRRKICGQDLDNGFGGWGGTASMTDPSWPFDLRLSSSTARFFQVYSPPAGGIFVAEPVSHANAALNEPESQWAELGLRVLKPGEQMTLDMRLDVIGKQEAG
jgi:aldose 1-epimerase